MPSHTSRGRPDLRRAGAALVAIAALVGTAGLPALARPSDDPPPNTVPKITNAVPDPDPPPLDEPRGPVPALFPGLERIPVSSPEFDAASRHLDRDTEELDRVRAIIRSAAQDLEVLGRRDDALTRKVEAARHRVATHGAEVRRTRSELRHLAVASYVSGQELSGVNALFELDANRHNELRSQAVMVDTVNTDLVDHLRVTTGKLQVARTDVTLTTATRRGIRERITEVRAVRARAGEAEREAVRAAFIATAEVETWRRVAIVDGTDVSLVVLDGYLKAAQITALLDPGCGIPWWALAGTGRTESHHGTAGGAEVRADGSLTKPILGIPLDGSGETAAIPRGDGQADRAQGPMQFITSTWEKWGFDGNGDGVADVQNSYDATATAAAYLCAGGPMRTDDDFRRGYFSYNHSTAYADVVLARAHEYEREIEIPEPAAG
jgi:hypothetical protein